jgi:hypothetical protein
MLWIPTALTEREFWAEKIYGTSDIQKILRTPQPRWPQIGGVWFDYARSRRPLSPEPTAFWIDAGFNTEEELDKWLPLFASKLKNFDYANALNVIKSYIENTTEVEGPATGRIPISREDREARKQEYEWEYQHYLGPIKFALKYDVPQRFIYGGSVYSAPMVIYIGAPGATTRKSLIITLYDGTKLQAISKNTWYVPLREILQLARLPNVVSIEASDTPYSPPLGATVDPAKLWNDVKGLVYRNYVKYMSQSGGPSTTQPPAAGAPPTAPTGGITSKTWLWVAAGVGGLVLLWILLRKD